MDNTEALERIANLEQRLEQARQHSQEVYAEIEKRINQMSEKHQRGLDKLQIDYDRQNRMLLDMTDLLDYICSRVVGSVEFQLYVEAQKAKILAGTYQRKAEKS